MDTTDGINQTTDGFILAKITLGAGLETFVGIDIFGVRRKHNDFSR